MGDVSAEGCKVVRYVPLPGDRGQIDRRESRPAAGELYRFSAEPRAQSRLLREYTWQKRSPQILCGWQDCRAARLPSRELFLDSGVSGEFPRQTD